MYKIAVDLGYGFTKAINQEGEEIMFPSLVGTGYYRPLTKVNPSIQDTFLKPLLNELDIEVREINSLGITEPNREYFIGELARRESRDVSYAFADNKITHPNTRALLLTACALLTKKETSDIHLITGLPVQQYDSQKQEIEKYLTGKEYQIKFLSGYWSGVTKKINIKKVTVVLQAGAALYTTFLGLNGEIHSFNLLEKASLIGLIDIGFKTTDYVVLDRKNGFEYLNEYSNTIKIGMNNAYLTVKKEIENIIKEPIDLADLDEAIFQQRITYSGNEYDLSNIINQAYSSLTKSIIDRLEIAWPKKNFYSHLFLAGGGGAVLKNYFNNFHHNLILTENAQMANARGYMALANIISDQDEIKDSVR